MKKRKFIKWWIKNKILKKKVQSLFDIDKETLEFIKEEFPENQEEKKQLK